MKKNLNKKTYKIPFLYNKEECKVEIIYQNSHSYFHINVTSKKPLSENEIKIIADYMRDEGFFDDAKEFYSEIQKTM
jgi:hypothetical protein